MTKVNQITPALFNTYDNINFFIERTKPYNPKGRLGGEDNAIKSDQEILQLLKEGSYPFVSLPDGDKITSRMLFTVGIK